MNLYVGNLPFRLSEEELRQVFEEYGEVKSANIIMDRETGRSKGFAFVEMDNDDDAQKAIDSLNEADLKGRNIRVNQARPKEDRPRQRNRY